MITNENELVTHLQTLKDCKAWPVDSAHPCEIAYQEVMEFLKKDGPLQQELKSLDMLKNEGNSITFSPTLYPKEKE